MKKIILFFCALSFSCFSQKPEEEKKYLISAIGFWNVENLYDTLNDQWKNDEDFTPEGANAWTGKRYRTKISHLADVIGQMATDVTPDGLAIIGLCEVENKSVVQDLVNAPQLKSRNYQFIHIEGPDARGVDPSFIYNPAYFKVTAAMACPVKMVTDSTHHTRDILVISGTFLGEPVAVLVNHWPSRRGGELRGRANRNGAAKRARQIADSIGQASPGTKIIIMGDLNDDPVNESVKKNIGTYGDLQAAKKNAYFNPMEKPYQQGIGTLAFQDSWNLFDQILLNQPWIPGDYSTWQYYTVRIFNKAFLKSDYGNFKSYPLRTYSGANYTGGYSDHFPVFIVIAKEKSR